MLVKWISNDIFLSLMHLKINYQNAVGGQFYSKGQNITIICLQSVWSYYVKCKKKLHTVVMKVNTTAQTHSLTNSQTHTHSDSLTHNHPPVKHT